MKLRICSIAIATIIASGLVASRTAEAAGQLAGNWRFDISVIAGSSPVPFTPPGNVFTISQPQANGGIQGQNMPQTGAPLCAFTGVQDGLFLSGTEVCGIPRNSFGAFRGIAFGLFVPNIYMIWADSKGVYYIQGTKLAGN